MRTIEKILELHELALNDVKKYKKHRYIFNQIIKHTGKSFLGITGLRGVGKSIILKQIAKQNSDSLYLSLDTLKDVDLFEIIRKIKNHYRINTFLLDEVHFCRDISEILKKIYDLLDVKIIFTSSVSLGMYQSAYDLSRRVRLIEIHPLL